MVKITSSIISGTIRFKFLLYLGTGVTLFTALVFFWLYQQAERGVIAQLDAQSKFLLQQVVLTRAWVADHGGLFVSQKSGVKANPFLPKSEIVDNKGNVYLYRNPAMVTREISEYANRAGLYKFRLTSLKLKNPANKPTLFERNALLKFYDNGYERSKNGTSYEAIENGEKVYSRVIPLVIEKSCLECHADQGYLEGDVRGGLSVIIPMTSALATLRDLRNKLWLSFFGLICFTSLMLYYLIKVMVLRPVDHLHQVAGLLVKGDNFVRASLTTNDEFEDLANAFNNMTDRLNTGYEGAIKALIATVEAKDPYTKGHTARVARYSISIAKEMNLSDKMVREIELGAILHDIGKIGVADEILLKPEALVGEEKKQMEEHVRKGEDIINEADFLLSALPAISYHHERPDGTGYPKGVKGDSLPLMASIIAVADSFDAMTTDRTYRLGMSKLEAILEIEKHAGKQFDIEVVKAFKKAFYPA